jgi:hypothetical protein
MNLDVGRCNSNHSDVTNIVSLHVGNIYLFTDVNSKCNGHRVVLYCSSQDNLDEYVHLEERKYLVFLGQLKQGYQKRAFKF